MGGAYHGDTPADGDDQGRDLRGSNFGVRQLRGGFGDGSLRSAASLRAQPVGTHHSARRRNPRSGGNRSAAARRPGAVPLRKVPDGFQEIESHPGCLRACREPHREHRGSRIRAGARTRHLPATGSDPRTLYARAAASRLLGATVIVTGLSPEIAQTLVTIGVDLGKMNTVGDLQGGIEQAERLLGYKVETLAEPR